MNQVKIELSIDPTNPTHVSGLTTFLTILGDVKTIPVSGAEVVEKPKRSRGPNKPKKDETPKDETPKDETPKDEIVEENSNNPGNDHGIKLTDLRALLSEKVADNRKEIKAKLTALKAANLTTLPEELYPDMKEFLDSL